MSEPDKAVACFQSVLADAYALRQLGQFEAAWLRLEQITHFIDRSNPQTLTLRVQLCANLGLWEMGLDFLPALAGAEDETHRLTCAEFLHGYARHLTATDDLDRALLALEQALALWPAIRIELVEDETLAPLWWRR